MIKKAIRLALVEKETAAAPLTTQRSFWRQRLSSRTALGALALAACVAVVATLELASLFQNARQTAQIARINATIDRVTLATESAPFALDPQSGGIASGLTSSETPTLSFVGEDDLGMLPRSLTASNENESPDPSSPPG